MKVVHRHKGWTIYEVLMMKYRGWECSPKEMLYLAFLPGDSPKQMDSPEFECQSIDECIENINSY